MSCYPARLARSLQGDFCLSGWVEPQDQPSPLPDWEQAQGQLSLASSWFWKVPSTGLSTHICLPEGSFPPPKTNWLLDLSWLLCLRPDSPS